MRILGIGLMLGGLILAGAALGYAAGSAFGAPWVGCFAGLGVAAVACGTYLGMVLP